MQLEDKIIRSPGPETGLSVRVVRGGFWAFVLRLSERLLGLVRLVILARLLMPHDFGLIGIVLLIIAILETFSRTGFLYALTQKREDIRPYLDVVWSVLIFRAFILYGILYLIAPFAASFFKSTEVIFVTQVLGISVILQAFTNVGVVYFLKELEFKKYCIYRLSGTLADFIVALLMTIILRNVWALVFGILARDLVRLIISYLIHSYRPKFNLNLKKANELFGFGKWILGSSILGFVVTQGDDLFVGRLLGVIALGFYQIAYKISNMPATEIAHVVSQVSFPAFSKLQDNKYRLREAYLRVLRVTVFLSFFSTALIFALAPDFTRIFLGEKWISIVPVMQILVIAGLIRSIAATTGSIFFAIGRPKIDTMCQIVRCFVLISLIYPFSVRWGILGASLAVLLSILISAVGFCFMCIKVTGCSIKIFTKNIILPLINAVIVVLSISGLKTLIGTGIWEFCIYICMGAIIYFIIAYLSDKFLNYKLRDLIKEGLKVLRNR